MSLFPRKRPAVVPPSPPVASASWLAWPTLTESNTLRPIAGTSHYQAAIARAANGQTDTGPNTDLVTAELRLVDEGQFAGAVEVRLAGETAGHVKADESAKYRPILEALTTTGRIATCRANIVGGHRDPASDESRSFGVWLLQPAEPRIFSEAVDPFLPPLGGMTTELRPGVEPYLDGLIPGRARRKSIATRGLIVDRGNDWAIEVGEQDVGWLAVAYDDPTLAKVRAAAAAGFPLTCQVRVIRDPERPLRLAADLP